MVIAGLCARRAGCESTEAVLGYGAMYDRCIGVIRYGDAYVNVARRGESSMMTAIFDDMSESEDGALGQARKFLVGLPEALARGDRARTFCPDPRAQQQQRAASLKFSTALPRLVGAQSGRQDERYP